MSKISTPNVLLSDHEQLRTEALTRIIAAQIGADGPALGFEQFMDLALYHPDHGYYMSSAEKFGSAGDFVTAPGLTSLFGASIGNQVGQIIDANPEFGVLEYGAGAGQLAVAILRQLEKLESLPRCYEIIEISPLLRDRQMELFAAEIPHLLSLISWLEQCPAEYCGVILANELLDAMPVMRFIKTGQGFAELVVDRKGEELILDQRGLTDGRLDDRFDSLALEVDYRSEVNFTAEAWVSDLAARLGSGAVLLIDYGYSRTEFYHPQRQQGTFLCYFRHSGADDPLRYPGLQDMTAHVDFTAMAEAADEAGLDVSGFTTQANFLLSCGLLEQLELLNGSDDYLDALGPVKQLLLPGGMGETFKVLALTRGLDYPLLGFSTRDIRHTL
ncbi:MAG: SAM-dependent methyltransferase [Immundisolibacteraceae bacterium]|nr:SAM-dependent methyltransferase [Immundisolibacteraceae bacterium]